MNKELTMSTNRQFSILYMQVHDSMNVNNKFISILKLAHVLCTFLNGSH